MDRKHHLVIDTCVWLELINLPPEILNQLSYLVNENKVSILLSDLILEEFERNKNKIENRRIARFKGAKKQVEILSDQITPEDSKIIEDVLSNYSSQEELILERIETDFITIEEIFNHPSTLKIPITDEIKLQAVQLALGKKAPFHNKSSMADALILLSAVDYIKEQKIINTVFITLNTTDFSNDNDKTLIHEDLDPIISEIIFEYSVNIGEALNKIEDQIISNEAVQRVSEMVIVREMLEGMLKSIATVSPLQQEWMDDLAKSMIIIPQFQQDMMNELAKSMSTLPQLQQDRMNELAKSVGTGSAIQKMMDDLAKSMSTIPQLQQDMLNELAKSMSTLPQLQQNRMNELAKSVGTGSTIRKMMDDLAKSAVAISSYQQDRNIELAKSFVGNNSFQNIFRATEKQNELEINQNQIKSPDSDEENKKKSGKFIQAIRKAVHNGKLKEPFRAADVKEAVPGFAEKTYPVFLPKHRKGNPGGNTELFVRVSPGVYKLLNT